MKREETSRSDVDILVEFDEEANLLDFVGLSIKDILEAMESIERFVEGMDMDRFKKDDKTSIAVM